MHFIYAEWLRHGRPNEATSIFGIDIQPHGTRLATCGQDCAVKVWHLPLLASLAEGMSDVPKPDTPSKSNDQSADPSLQPRDPQQPNRNEPINQQSNQAQQSFQQQAISSNTPPPGALLATIRSHTAAVNVVRWSPNGTLLASAGDDHVVLIYYRAKSSAPMFGELPSAETWLVRRPLRAHSSDVTDLAWSPDAERLASASVDNTIVVWNVQTDTPLVRLDGHVGLVKGLAWDPVGRFLASQSDDRTVRIWRTTDWKPEKVLSEPFQSAVFEENSMSFFLRISWSPCGSHLVAVNAHRKPATQYAPMFSRQADFSDPIEFIGHREPVISARFSPCLYRRREQKTDDPTAAQPSTQGPTNAKDGMSDPLSATYTVLALGSKDGGCSVWRATGARPFFEMYDAFEMEVIDIAWGSDGHTMVACSTDGRVLYVRFTPEELGVVVPPEEARVILTNLWRSFGAGSINAAAPLPESAAQLEMEAANESSIINQPSSSVAAPAPAVATQATKSSSAAVPSTPLKPPATTQIPGPVISAAEAARQNGPTPPADPKLMAAQAETRGRGGKRRIVPMAIPTDGESPFDGSSNRPPTGSQTAPAAGITEPTAVLTSSTTPQPMAVDNFDAFPSPSPAKRPRTTFSEKEDVANGSLMITNDVNGDPATNGTTLREERLGMTAIPQNATRVTHASELHAPSVIGLSLMILPDPNGDGRGRCRVFGKGDASVILESHELGTEAGGFIVTCSSGGKVKWRDYHAKGYAITALAGIADKFAAVGTWDGALFLYSASSGRRLTPPIVMDSAPYMLEAYSFPGQHTNSNPGESDLTLKEKWYVIVITRSALCSVFDVKEKKMVCARSAAWLLARASSSDSGGKPNGEGGGTPKAKFVREVSHCQVTPFGEPILILSDGHSFVYSRDLCAWVRVADDSLPNSEFRRTVKGSDKVGLLRLLQSGSGRRQKGVGSLTGMGDLRRAAVESLAHLESLMESAIVVGSPEDYRYYLANYAARIAAAVNDDVESCTLRLREVCDQLLNADCPEVDRRFVGLSGRKLLKETVLPIISENREMQRLVAEYAECLSRLEN